MLFNLSLNGNVSDNKNKSVYALISRFKKKWAKKSKRNYFSRNQKVQYYLGSQIRTSKISACVFGLGRNLTCSYLL